MKPRIDRISGVALTSLFILTASLPAVAQSAVGQTGDGTCCVSTTLEPTTVAEAKWLGFMREEEKLARDVYQQLYSKWKLRIFANIARSESQHFSIIGGVIARYGVTDPSLNLPAGTYADPNLTSLYYRLLEKGMTSVKDAIEVGALIEQQDIADLESALKDTAKTDIKTVYTNLLAGSLNHLESFEHTLEITTAVR